MTHPDEYQVMQYVKKLASEDEANAIDLHMAECSNCFDKIQGLLNARENLDPSFRLVNVDTWGALKQEEHLEEAILQTPNESLKAKLKQWLAEGRTKPGLVFQAFLDSAARLTTIANTKAPVEYMFQSFPYDLTSRFVPTMGDPMDQQIRDLSDQAERKLKNLDIQGVENVLQQVVALQSTVHRKFRDILIKNHLQIGFIESDSINQSIGVYLFSPASEVIQAVTKIVPFQSGVKPVFKELILTRVDDIEYYLALFENLTDTLYTIELKIF